MSEELQYGLSKNTAKHVSVPPLGSSPTAEKGGREKVKRTHDRISSKRHTSVTWLVGEEGMLLAAALLLCFLKTRGGFYPAATQVVESVDRTAS